MFRVDHLAPVYLDLRVVTAAIESQRDGYDPLRENPRDPLKRVMNYPRTWLLLSHLGITQQETVPIGIGIDLVFFAALLIMIGPITPQQGILYALLVCSPAIMLGVERANIDLLLFVLLSAAIVLFSRRRTESNLPYAIVTLCGLLKLYPICALSVALRERAQRAITIIGSGVTFFVLYLHFIRHDLGLIWRGTPRLTNQSYGSEIIFQKVYTHYFGDVVLNDMLPRLYALFAIFLVAAAAILVFLKLPRPTFEKKAFESMNIGAAIYAGTFAFLHNFDYRLVFLILLVPQLLYWMKRKDTWRYFAVLCIAAIAIALYVPAENRYWRTILIKESVEWFLFGCCLLLLLEMLPNWLIELSVFRGVRSRTINPSAIGEP